MANHIETYPLDTMPNFSIKISDSISPIKTEWDKATSSNNLFLQSIYLEMLEKFPPEKMTFKYVIFYQKKEIIGVSYHQVFRLKIEDSINSKEDAEEVVPSYCIVKGISKAVKKWFIKRADFNLLISGNLLLTGEYGFYFRPEYEGKQAASLVQIAMSKIQNVLDKTGEKISLHLIKDHPKEEVVPLEKELCNKSYHSFLMQPCMEMPIRSEWTDFEAYLSSMSSKYRVRARRARKKGAAIVKKELTLEEMAANEEKIHQLYTSIAEGVGFNAFLLHPSYFTMLKQTLGDRYKLVAYYIDGEMVAFYTAIFNYGEMDAHFLGVNEQYNRAHQVYLNILYDLVNTAIENKCHRLDFARTALEIKSSVGAVAQDMVCFIKHRNSISSKFLNVIFDYINPKEEWKARSPFKAKKEVEA